ncbi:hypothetical protein PR048_001464 [Dryococelus australis]|uniref:Uncharacterized protein n=1 Tax=Dryococelus australis TaxID=614101 RepID=A0ABQ9II53_9NEOP|nr:hypothetical protein PR048_001464 [Dryococelus australis]
MPLPSNYFLVFSLNTCLHDTELRRPTWESRVLVAWRHHVSLQYDNVQKQTPMSGSNNAFEEEAVNFGQQNTDRKKTCTQLSYSIGSWSQKNLNDYGTNMYFSFHPTLKGMSTKVKEAEEKLQTHRIVFFRQPCECGYMCVRWRDGQDIFPTHKREMRN